MSASASAHPLAPLPWLCFPARPAGDGAGRLALCLAARRGSAEAERLEQRPRLQVAGLVGFLVRLLPLPVAEGLLLAAHPSAFSEALPFLFST
jgi:hypothetical protein